MPCYYPIAGWVAKKRNPSGKRSIVFNVKDGFSDRKVEVPCGQCVGCRESRAQSWALRMMCEAQGKDNSFITLTYSPANIPSSGSLIKSDFQGFMKRFRKAIAPIRIRFLNCGEYGSKLDRPHYHAAIFGYDFPDKELWTIREGIYLYRSKLLESCWECGFSSIGEFNYATALYISRYITKRITGDDSADHYQGRIPEYICMSRNPGIGADWIKKYYSDVFPHDFMTKDGKTFAVPRYFSNFYEKIEPDLFAKLKIDRVFGVRDNPDNIGVRLHLRGEVVKERVKSMERCYENSGL